MQGRACQLLAHLWSHLTCLLQVIKAFMHREKLTSWYFKMAVILHFLHWARLFLLQSHFWQTKCFCVQDCFCLPILKEHLIAEGKVLSFWSPKPAPQVYSQISLSKKTRTFTMDSKAAALLHTLSSLAIIPFLFVHRPSFGRMERICRHIGEEENSHDLGKSQKCSEIYEFKFN